MEPKGAQKDALGFDKSLCVTAGAGTGKTFVLVTRYFNLIEEAQCNPAKILVLTYTKLAASEMKDRVLKKLYEKEGPFWENVREDMMWAKISTIHSFCSRILHEFSYEAHISQNLALLEPQQMNSLIEEAKQQLFTRTENDELRESTRRCLVAWGENTLMNYLQTLYENRVDASNFFTILKEKPEDISGEWQVQQTEIQQKVGNSFLDNPAACSAANNLYDLACQYRDTDEPATRFLSQAKPNLKTLVKSDQRSEICMALVALQQDIKETKARTNMGKEATFGEVNQKILQESFIFLKMIIGDLPMAVLGLDCDPKSPAMLRTLSSLNDLAVVYEGFSNILDTGKKVSGAIDFTDQIALTYGLLKNNPAVREKMQKRFEYIMIDEYQDTDPMQAGIISLLLGGDGSDEPDTDRLFVVGDPKQSIYLFRNADVTQFKRTRDHITQICGGREVPLEMNFRSTPEVIHFANATFSRLFSDSEAPWEFHYDPITPSEKRKNDKGSVEILFTPAEGNALDQSIAEADILATKIKATIENSEKPVYWDGKDHLPDGRKATYGDCAVLIETRTNLEYYLDALNRNGVPYKVHSGVGFYETQEVIDMYNLLTFLCNNSDDIALYGILRSPWFGFSDADLFRASEGYGTGLFSRLLQSENKLIREAVHCLQRWSAVARTLPPSELLYTLIAESGIIAVNAALSNGAQRQANLDKLCDLVMKWERLGFYTIDLLVNQLGELIETKMKEGEAEADTDEDAVTVMTVHASKGLEFPIVFVPRLSESASGNTRNSVYFDRLWGIGIQISSEEPRFVSEESAPLVLIKYIYQQKTQAESRRMFYVAATRAKDHLVLIGKTPDPEKMPSPTNNYKNRTHMLYWNLSLPSRTEDTPKSSFTCTVDEALFDVHYISEPPGMESSAPEPELITLSECIEDETIQVSPVDAVECITHRFFSASEIERYISSPHQYLEQYIEGGSNRSRWSNVSEDVMWKKGVIVHEIFAGKTPEVAFAEQGIPFESELALKYQKQSEDFLSTDIMQSVEEDYTEVPFIVTIGGHVFKGNMDRLVKKGGRWAVIDYKAGNVHDPEEYTVQMAIYKEAAEKILNSPVDTYLYFTEPGELLALKLDLAKIRPEVMAACIGIEKMQNTVNSLPE